MIRVAIIAAMPGELKPLVKGWQHERRVAQLARPVDLWRRRNGDTELIAACSGPGQQAATRAFAEAEKDGPLVLAYSIGWVGALSESLHTRRAYTASGVIDMLTGERFQAQGAPAGLWLVTSPRVADRTEKQRLATAYGASLVDMEAAAVARLAAMRGIPFHCIKGVSDGFTEDLPDFNRFITPDGNFQTSRLLFFVLIRPWYWPGLIRMGENSNKASQAIRDLLLENLKQPGAIANQNGDSNFTR
jgi:adenosylhomocysteine nucleosidase